jgi:ABC-type bacteriocin/lantibiotic exporter with double-glycine peptidase domain
VRSSRWIWSVAAFTWVTLLLSCTIRLTEPDRFPESVRLHDAGPYLQDPEQCGPFALAALLQYMGMEADTDILVEKLYSPGAGGTLTMDLFLEARRRGLKTRQLSGSEDTLVKELEEYNPAIVLFKYPGLSGSVGHFILVTGYSDDPRGFFVLWGDGKLSWIKLDRFHRLWSESNYWMLTVHGEG